MVGVRLFVGNLSYAIGEEGLRDLLSPVGDIRAVTIPRDRVTHRPRGFALVDVAGEADAREIVRKFNGYPLDGRPLRVEEAREPEAVYIPKYRARPGVKGRPDIRPHRPERSPGR